MELNLSPATEAKLNDLAHRTGRGADELIEEAVNHLVDYDEWLERKIQPRLDALDSGAATISDADVRAWLRRQQERELQRNP